MQYDSRKATITGLHHYAKQWRIHPASFAGVDLKACGVDSVAACCNTWVQNDWEDRLSRDALRHHIACAESEIAAQICSPIAPSWTSETVYIGSSYRNSLSVQLKTRNVISAGIRHTAVVNTGQVDITIKDIDGDNFYEVADVLIQNVSSFPIGQAKFYLPDHGGDPAYEVHPVSVTHDPLTYEVSARFHSWDLIRPDVLTGSLLGGKQVVNLCCEQKDPLFSCSDQLKQDYFVSTLQIFREYNDAITASAWLHYSHNDCCGCVQHACQPNCACVKQQVEACIQVEDGALGFVTLKEPVDKRCCGCPTEYDSACLNIYAGECNPELQAKLREAVLLIASARMPSPCGCDICDKQDGSISSMSKFLNKVEDGNEWTLTPEMLEDAPFGLRLGEVLAWQIVREFVRRKPKSFMVI